MGSDIYLLFLDGSECSEDNTRDKGKDESNVEIKELKTKDKERIRRFIIDELIASLKDFYGPHEEEVINVIADEVTALIDSIIMKSGKNNETRTKLSSDSIYNSIASSAIMILKMRDIDYPQLNEADLMPVIKSIIKNTLKTFKL